MHTMNRAVPSVMV